MKLATYKWRVYVKENGKWHDDSYYGYKTKKLAEERVKRWNFRGYEAIVKKEEW